MSSITNSSPPDGRSASAPGDWRNPYLDGDYAPTAEVGPPAPLSLAAQLTDPAPEGLVGTYARNGPNPRYRADGEHHWFDGDGMIHALGFDGRGGLTYGNRFVASVDFHRESAVGHALWTGLLEATHGNPTGGPRYKDTANTDLVFHHGRLLALWYVCGTPIAVDPLTLETIGGERFVPADSPGADRRPLRVSAHCKVDPLTDELLFFDYADTAPYMSYGSLDPQGTLQWWHPVELDGARLPHDMAFTKNYALLMDLPVHPSSLGTKLQRWIVDYHADRPARFGLAPRSADANTGGGIRWFEAAPCYVYHSVNAWESADGRYVTLIGYRCMNPMPPSNRSDGPPLQAAAMANLRLRGTLHEWVFDLQTGQTSERPLDDTRAEFPVIDARRAGLQSQHTYAMAIPERSTLCFDGIVHHDLKAGTHDRYQCPPGRYLSEVGFAPNPKGTRDNDGWLVTIAAGGNAPSEAQVFDAAAVSQGPIARFALPRRVPLGFHATWFSP